MKVGIFIDLYEPHVAGVTTSVKLLKETLEEMHNEVYIVTANLTNNSFIYNKEEKTIYLPGIKTGLYESKLTSIYSNKAMKIIKTWNLDVIHSQTEFGVGTFSRIVSKKLNIPLVHTYHTMYEDYVYYVTHGRFDKLSKKIIAKLTRYYCDKSCDELIVPTEKIKNIFNEKYDIHREIHIVPTGIDLNKFTLTKDMKKRVESIKHEHNINKDDFIIGSVGRLASEKSYDKMINMMPKLLKICPNVKLMLVGDGPERENLEKQVKNLKLTSNVIFTGMVDYSFIPDYYNTFDVLSSYSTTETQGLTIIEGLAASKPVVCINDPSFTTIIIDGYNGKLINNDKEFCDVIKKLTEDKKLYNTMTINAKNSVHKYSKEVFASTILDVYYEAIMDRKTNLR